MLWHLAVAVLILLLSLWMRWRQKKLQIFMDLGIPGPKPNVLFGNMLEMYRKGPMKCHEEWIKKYGTICGFYLGMRPIVLIADVEVLKQVQIKEFQNFTNRAHCTLFMDDESTKKYDYLIHLRGKQWKETRSILTPTFTSGKLKQMVPTIMDAIGVTMELVEENSEKGQDFDIYQLWKGLATDVIGRTVLGIDADVQRNENHPLIQSARKIATMLVFHSPAYLIGHSFPEFHSVIRLIKRTSESFSHEMEYPVTQLMRGLAEVIRNRRKNNLRRPDLLQSLLDAKKTETNSVDVNGLTTQDKNFDECEEATDIGQNEEKHLPFFTDRQVVMNALMMYLAGIETTATSLATASHFLVKYPDVQEELRNELKNLIEKEGELSCNSVEKLPFMDQVLSESLRMYPPLHLITTREAGKDTEIKGYLIPKGMAVQVPVYWLHHNPDFWQDPERFNPSRFENDPQAKTKLTWQPFGAGPRNCIGLRFTLLEEKLALAKLLLKYRLEPSDRTEKGDTMSTLVGAMGLSPLNGVYVKATPLKE